MMILHIVLLEGEWNGGSHLGYCVIKMCYKGLKVSSMKWWLDSYCCMEQSASQIKMHMFKR